jgi:hypothetical protein
MGELPTGTVTFLFMVMEGSAPLAQQFPAELPALLKRHHVALIQIVGEESCVGLQHSAATVYNLSSERRLSRFVFVAEK